MRSDVVIVGGGVTGLGTALRLKTEACLFEKESRLGGCLRSEFAGGYTIDRTGHLMHFRDEYVRQVVFERLPIEWLHFHRNAQVHVEGCYVPYPIQYHLHNLPIESRFHCLMRYLDTMGNHPSLQESFERWSRSSFGDGLFELFFKPYNTKLWCADLASFTAEWAQRFVSMPDRELVVRGALGPHAREEFGYNATFSYPKHGGSQAIVDALANEIDIPIRTGLELNAIDPIARICEFSDGTQVRYRRLVTTIPLPRLLRLLHSADPGIVELADQLRHNSLLYFALGYETGGDHPDLHWLYVPDPKFLMYRVGVLSNYSTQIAPPGTILLCAELAFAGEMAKFADPEMLRERVESDLREIGIVKPGWRKSFQHHDVIDCAYVIFDDVRREALPRILGYLEQFGIRSIGRYGAWGYGSVGDALIEGRDCADRINAEYGVPSSHKFA